MVDYQVVCSMCGDVGFPDKLFRCNKCHNRFQHSYCSNYYSESSEPIEVCDWCKSEERSSARQGGSSSRRSSAGNDGGITNRSEYSGERIKQQHDREEGSERGGKNPGGTPSPRPTTRRPQIRHVITLGDIQLFLERGHISILVGWTNPCNVVRCYIGSCKFKIKKYIKGGSTTI